MANQLISRMSPTIVVLDLDETLGSFGLLFSIFTILQRTPKYSSFVPNVVVKPLLKLLIDDEIFRPGIEKFVKCISKMKRDKLIDYICINTNQSLPVDVSNKWSVTMFIVECLHTMAGDEFIDRVYTRDTSKRTIKNGSYISSSEIPKKDIDRIIKDFSTNESIENITFVDNMPELIIQNSKPLIDTIYKFVVYGIESYVLKIDHLEYILDYILIIDLAIESANQIRTYLQPGQVEEIYEIEEIDELKETQTAYEISSLVWNQYLTKSPQSSSNESYDLIHLQGFLYEKYKTVRLNTKAVLDKADPYTLTNEQCRNFWRKSSKN
jgi:hypothetical protein